MEPELYAETFIRLAKIVGKTIARQMVDEMDAEQTAAKTETERIRAIIRQELGRD